ncbi:hypothetical protein KFK09_000851 [Dendrobium nobile]|uniref:Uncharacterized protein n=1 Tax=Dendrobium nobile TaxID=94219 RepID=A0A8T3C9Q9_DENNO|nr:hypothetical protein KFK09_000851 [Dendrobium nobile]
MCEGEGSFGFVRGERDEVRGVTMATIRVDAVGIVMVEVRVTKMVEPLEDVVELHEWAKSENSQTPLGTQQIHLSDDEPSQFTDVGADGSMPTKWSDMQVMEDSTGTTKKLLPSSGIGSGIKRKSKTSVID